MLEINNLKKRTNLKILKGCENVKIKFELILGLLGFLGILGYIFNEPLYYTFFSFFSFFFILFRDLKIDVYRIITLFGSVALILSGLTLIVAKTTSYLLGIIVLLGILAFMISFFSYIGIDEPKDERLKKIGTVATTHSWYLTLIFISFIIINSIWSGNESIGIEKLGLILFVMVATMVSVNIYLNWKGDVD